MSKIGHHPQQANILSFLKRCMASKFTHHRERYVELVRILQKYRLYDIVSQLGQLHNSTESRSNEAIETCTTNAENLARALEEMGTCFIKLGQLLSTRADLLPIPYITALTRLQDTVTPVAGNDIAGIIESELNAPLSFLFRSVEREPLATASIAQVHKAVLHDGTSVIVKVQRPGVSQQVKTDVGVMHELASFLTRHTPFGTRYGLLPLVQELKQTLHQELDFQQEADNTQLISRSLRSFRHLIIPSLYPEYSSHHVLTLGFIRGKHLSQFSREELQRLPISAIAQDLFSAYLKQIIIDGTFHCDPHPGNILLTDDGRLALLDFGMLGRFDAGQKENVTLLLLAFAERQGKRVADIYLEMIDVPDEFDRLSFTREICSLVSRYHDMSNGRMEIGRALLELATLAQSYHTLIPASFVLLGKTMLNLDSTLHALAPALNPVQVIRHYIEEVIYQQARDQLSPARTYTWYADARHLIENMPRRTDIISEKLAHDRLTLRLKIERLDTSIQMATRRLSLSMIVSSMMIGAGLFFASRRLKD